MRTLPFLAASLACLVAWDGVRAETAKLHVFQFELSELDAAGNATKLSRPVLKTNVSGKAFFSIRRGLVRFAGDKSGDQVITTGLVVTAGVSETQDGKLRLDALLKNCTVEEDGQTLRETSARLIEKLGADNSATIRLQDESGIRFVLKVTVGDATALKDRVDKIERPSLAEYYDRRDQWKPEFMDAVRLEAFKARIIRNPPAE